MHRMLDEGRLTSQGPRILPVHEQTRTTSNQATGTPPPAARRAPPAPGFEPPRAAAGSHHTWSSRARRPRRDQRGGGLPFLSLQSVGQRHPRVGEPASCSSTGTTIHSIHRTKASSQRSKILYASRLILGLVDRWEYQYTDQSFVDRTNGMLPATRILLQDSV